MTRLGPAYVEFDRLMQDRAFLDFIGEVTGIPRLLYDPKYVGGGTHENLSGQDLDPHVDFNYHPHSKLHRRLNLILFLNPEWRPEWGGALELHEDPWRPEALDQVTSILPIRNRCVLFETTESSWHGFRRIELPAERPNLSRRSIAVYFYTRERPLAETAPDHSTVYVPRPLPGYLKPGYTLTARDLQTLQDLLGRRDRMIRFLYEREQEFGVTLGRILRSPTFRLARALAWPIRALVKHH